MGSGHETTLDRAAPISYKLYLQVWFARMSDSEDLSTARKRRKLTDTDTEVPELQERDREIQPSSVQRRRDRRFCPHCKEELSLKTYKFHRRLYFEQVTKIMHSSYQFCDSKFLLPNWCKFYYSLYAHNTTHIQERDHWNTTALTHCYEDVSGDEDSAPGTPQSFDLEKVQRYESPTPPPQLPTFEDLETGYLGLCTL